MKLPCLRCGSVCAECGPGDCSSPAKKLAAYAEKLRKEKERSDKFWELYCRYMGAMYGGLSWQ